jgi:hypothetical protein
MTQLEQWNAEVLALSAPSSAQFLKDEFTLARLYRNDPTVAERSAEVRLASADTGAAKPAESAKPATPPVVQAVAERPAAQPPMIHRASFATAEAPAKPKPAVEVSTRPKPAAANADKPAAQRIASAAPVKPESERSKPTAKPAKPAAQRTASAAAAKPDTAASRPAAKPPAKTPAKPDTVRTAAAKPVRESASASRSKGKGGGGN